MDRTNAFSATLYKIGMNYCVDIPESVTASWKDRHVPVKLVVQGLLGTTTALRRKDGGYRVFVNVSLRELSDLEAGSKVNVRVEPTSELSEPEIPEDLERALARRKTNRSAWTALTLRQRRDFVRYLEEAKGTDTRKKRLAQGLETIRRKTRR